MKITQADFNNPHYIFDNLDNLTAQAKQARAEAVGELASVVVAWVVALPAKFAAWRHNRAAADQLMQLDDRMLHDIGIGRGEIQATIAGRMENNAVNSNAKGRNASCLRSQVW